MDEEMVIKSQQIATLFSLPDMQTPIRSRDFRRESPFISSSLASRAESLVKNSGVVCSSIRGMCLYMCKSCLQERMGDVILLENEWANGGGNISTFSVQAKNESSFLPSLVLR
jgi:hypothetical protein